MIIKVFRHSKNVKSAIDYVMSKYNSKKQKREVCEVVYGNPSEVLAFSKTSEFRHAVRKLNYFSGVLAFPQDEHLNRKQLSYLIKSFAYVLTNNNQADIPFFVVKHIEQNKEHYHFVGLRYDLNSRKFYNPFRPGWRKKFVAWAKLIERVLQLKKVQRKRSTLEREFYDTALLVERTSNAELKAKLDVKLKALETAFLIDSFSLEQEVDDERLKKILRRANKRDLSISYPKYTAELRQYVQKQVERDRKYNAKFTANKSPDNGKSVLDSCKYVLDSSCFYPRFQNIEKPVAVSKEVDMQKILNSKDELEVFKRINLVNFMISNCSGQILERSSPSSFRIEINKEKFLVSWNNEQGHWLFLGIDDPSKRGSIIDCCNLFLNIRNLGEIRKKLREFIISTPGAFDNPSTFSDPIDFEMQAAELRADYSEVLAHPLWTERAIDVNKIKDLLVDVKLDKRNNLCFPMLSADRKVIGYEIKGLKSFKQNIGSKQGVVLLGNSSKRLVLTESVIDALSYYELSDDKDCALLSISGQLTVKQIEQIKKIVLENRINEVIFAFDNDDQGRKYAEILRKHFASLQIKIREHFPVGSKDWNDSLRQFKFLKSKTRRIE